MKLENESKLVNGTMIKWKKKYMYKVKSGTESCETFENRQQVTQSNKNQRNIHQTQYTPEENNKNYIYHIFFLKLWTHGLWCLLLAQSIRNILKAVISAEGPPNHVTWP